MITIASIRAAVAAHYRLPVTDMTSPERTWCVSHPRQVAMCLARRMLPHVSRSAIARRFNRTSWTVCHAERAVACRLRTDPKLRGDVRAIYRALRGDSHSSPTFEAAAVVAHGGAGA
jgi:chromosomal replication initiator protein